MIESTRLKHLLAHLPGKPGVYLMSDPQGTVIYVGKSRYLKNRIRSYFAGKRRDAKTELLVQTVSDLAFIVTENEVEALILENNLIKRHKPHFNIMLKDSKTHPYLQVTLSEDYPRILKVRRVRFNDGNRYFGPFPDERGLKLIREILTKNYHVCDCSVTFSREKAAKKACLNHHLGYCPGPCIHAITPEAYRQNIEGAMRFLAGQAAPDLNAMKKRMQECAEAFRYEEAAELRNMIDALEQFFTRQKVELVKPVDLNLWGTAHSLDLLVASVFFIRAGKLLGNRTIEVEREPGIPPEELLGTLMSRFYDQNLIPRKILSNTRPRPMEALIGYLESLARHSVRLARPVRGAKKRLLDMAQENAAEVLRNLKSPEKERVAENVLDLEQRLQLPRTPYHIECIDISHVQGADTVGSLVSAMNGRPRKSEYRLFHIKTVVGVDDPASIAEVTRRRFERLRREGASFPDLFIVDGGITQVRAAEAVFCELGLSTIPLFGLAKREETLVKADGTSISLPITSPGMRLLIGLRNESHRFAHGFQRKTHARRVMRSALLTIPGVGTKTLLKILQAFGSLDRAAAETPEAIALQAKIPEKTARLIHASIQPTEKP